MSKIIVSNAIVNSKYKFTKYHKLVMKGVSQVLNTLNVTDVPAREMVLEKEDQSSGAAIFDLPKGEKVLRVPATFCLQKGDDNYSHLYASAGDMTDMRFELPTGTKLPFILRVRAAGNIYLPKGKVKKDPVPNVRSGFMLVYISSDAIPHFANLPANYTQLVNYNLNSRYAIRGSELLAQYHDTGIRIEHFKNFYPLMGLKGHWDDTELCWVGEYSRWETFKRRVLTPMQRELNGVDNKGEILTHGNNFATQYAFIYKYIKHGRRIVGLEFHLLQNGKQAKAADKATAKDIVTKLKAVWKHPSAPGMLSLMIGCPIINIKSSPCETQISQAIETLHNHYYLDDKKIYLILQYLNCDQILQTLYACQGENTWQIFEDTFPILLIDKLISAPISINKDEALRLCRCLTTPQLKKVLESARKSALKYSRDGSGVKNLAGLVIDVAKKNYASQYYNAAA